MPDSSFAVLARAFAQHGEESPLLPSLHHHIVSRTAALCSVLIETDPETRDWVGTSAYGAFPDSVRLAESEAQTLERAARTEGVIHVTDLSRVCEPLARALGAAAAIVARLSPGDRPALLVVGLGRHAPPVDLDAAREAASAFGLALEWTRLRHSTSLQRRLREVVLALSRGVTTTRSLTSGFDAMCLGTNAVLGARRTSIWIHDRRARQLVMQGSSEAGAIQSAATIGADDPRSSVAVALRLDRPEFRTPRASTEGSLLLVPLRGRRRALGALVVEGVAAPPGERTPLLEAARDLGRQLSNVIENVQLLNEVLRSRRELEDTFNSLADLVAVCDRQHRIVSVNQAFARRVSRDLERLRELPLADFVGAELAAWVAAQAPTGETRSRTAPTRQFEDPRLRGIFSVTATALISHEENPIGTVVVMRDVTEQARLEADRAALRQQLAQSEKLAALGQFVAGIAHELNNPLQGVLGHLELMKATGELTRAQTRDLGVAYREADRAAKIVSSLLVFAGSGRRTRRRCNLNTLVSRALKLRAVRLRKAGITVARKLDPLLPRVVGDPLLLQQALFNIILNAEHAMAGAPGRLEITSMRSRDGEWALVRVHDSGPGLSEAVLSRVFEPFFTTKDVGKGTGLGLSITYGIIQDHSGQIRAENHPHGGAVFTVELPTDKLVIK
jgi:signal transduction histidine kinase